MSAQTFSNVSVGSSVVLNKNTFTNTDTTYSFIGWSENENATTPMYSDCASIPITSNKNEIKLYAVWSNQTVNITFNSNGGQGTMSKQKVVAGTPLTKNTFTKPNYTFKGWSTNQNATIKDDLTADGASCGNVTSDETLYAIWGIKVIYDSNAPQGFTSTVKTSEVWYTKEEGSNATLEMLQIAGGYSDYYDFLGWSENKNATTATYTGSSSITANITKSTTLYGIWKQNKWKVKFYQNADSSDTVCHEIEVPKTKNGYTITQEELISQYSFNSWNFKNDTKALLGWYEKSLPNNYSNNVNVRDACQEFYAKWAESFAIKFMANGGSGTMNDQVVPQYIKTTLKKNTFTKSGYIFVGWEKQDTYQTKYKDEAAINLSSNITLKAMRLPNPVNVTYDLNGGVGSTTQSITLTEDDIKNKDIDHWTITINIPEPTKTGYTFFGWTTSGNDRPTNYIGGLSNGAQHEISLNSAANNSVTYFMAIWIKDKVTITYNTISASKLSTFSPSVPASEELSTKNYVSIDPTTKKYELTSKRVKLSAEPIGITEAFYGWSTTGSRTFTSISAAQNESSVYKTDDFQCPLTNTVVCANFVSGSDAIKITFNGNGDGTMGGDTKKDLGYVLKNSSLKLPTLNTIGISHAEIANRYNFICWTTDKTNKNLDQPTQPNYTNIAREKSGWTDGDTVSNGFNSDTTLYAYWWKTSK